MRKQIVVHQFYCEIHDWLGIPFRITKTELEDAGGWIACDICGKACTQLEDIEIDVWKVVTTRQTLEV